MSWRLSKHRSNILDTPKSLSILCRGWKKFYANTLPQFQVLADQIKNNKELNSSFQLKVKKISRNSLCLCGSGKKYKECCIRWGSLLNYWKINIVYDT